MLKCIPFYHSYGCGIELIRRFFILLFCVCFFPFNVFSQEQDKVFPVNVTGDQISYQDKKVQAQGHVRMEYKGMELFCDEGEYDAQKHVAHLKRNIKIVRDKSVIYGEDIIYDFNTHNAQMMNSQIKFPPIYGRAQTVTAKGKDEYSAEKGYVTTCDREQPHYTLHASKVTIYPDKKVTAKNMILKVGNVPVFYFPYFSLPLTDRSFPLELYPGKKDEWGYYFLSRYRYFINEKNKGKMHLDWYDKRGVGTGITHKADMNKWGEALLSGYYIKDDLYRLGKREELFNKYPERKNIPSGFLEEDRYKLQLSYRNQLLSNLSITGEFHKFSDKYFMKDFFYREYDREQHPLTYALVDYSFPYSSVSLFTQKRMNRFFEETEYLPQLEHNFYNQSLGGTNFYFESKSTVGNIRHVFDATDPNAALNPDYDVSRLHSHDVVSYVQEIDWLKITPYVGTYTTIYSKDLTNQNDVSRFAPEAGVNLSTKLSKISDINFNLFGTKADKIRHILTPQLSYKFIDTPSVKKDRIFQFDEIDDLERINVIEFKVDNKWQLRDDKKVWDFVYFSPSVEYQFSNAGIGSHFEAIKADLEIYPRPGLSFNSDFEFDCPHERVKTVNADVTFSDPDKNKYSVSLGHRYAHEDGSQGTVGLTYQMTPSLQFKNYMRYDYLNGRFQEQQYVIRRDLHCWWGDVGLSVDHEKEFSVWFVFTLKDFPDIHLGLDHTYNGAKDKY